MAADSARPRDTREFIAAWNAATEQHLVQKVADALTRLGSDGSVAGLTAAQAKALAPLVVHAFQVAASADGGPHLAAQYLAELAGSPPKETSE